MEERQVEQRNDMENTEKRKLKCEKRWKIQRKSKLNSEKIGKMGGGGGGGDGGGGGGGGKLCKKCNY